MLSRQEPELLHLPLSLGQGLSPACDHRQLPGLHPSVLDRVSNRLTMPKVNTMVTLHLVGGFSGLRFQVERGRGRGRGACCKNEARGLPLEHQLGSTRLVCLCVHSPSALGSPSTDASLNRRVEEDSRWEGSR